jgi:hypothetical protein
MRITGQERVSEGLVQQAGGPAHFPSSPKTASSTESSSSPVTSKLSALFHDSGIDVSPVRLQALASAITSLGLTLSDINQDTALRALILQLNGISLTPGLLLSGQNGGETIPERLIQLQNTALSVLEQKGISSGIRAALETFVKDVDAWFSTGIAQTLPHAVQKGGLSFEWQLLAWYRAGRDPERLQALLHEDMKGVLINLLQKIGKAGKKSGAGALKKFDEDAAALLDSITSRQLSSLASVFTDRRSVYFEIFWGERREPMKVRILAEGRKERQKNNVNKQNFSLVLEVETSHLGPVQVLLQISGKTLSASMLLKNEEAADLAGSMADEIKDSLLSRGYELGTIRFGLQRLPVKNEPPAGSVSGGVDIRG